MPIEKHVVSQEVAEKLKDYLPEKYESCFVWIWHDNEGKYVLEYKADSDYADIPITKDSCCCYSTPLLGEMEELLPEYIDKEVLVDNKMQVVRFHWMSTARAIQYTYLPNTSLSLKDTKSSFNSIGKHNINKATACAEQYMRMIDNGYITKETNT